jgi:hypothetical protein
MSGFEELLIRQGGMFLGLFVLIAVAYICLNAIVKKDS